MAKTILAVLSLALFASCDLVESTLGKKKFSCTKRSGDWGLYKEQPDGPELIACFGGMYESADDEKVCQAALKYGDVGAGHYYCSVFP